MTRFAAGPADSPGFRLWHVTLAWQRSITAALAPLDLTHVQFVLLACTWWLTEQDGPPRQVDLARQAGADVKMTSQVLRTLESRALLARTVDPADTRSRRLTLSAAGRTLAERAVTVVEAVDDEFFGTAAPSALRLFDRLVPH